MSGAVGKGGVGSCAGGLGGVVLPLGIPLGLAVFVAGGGGVVAWLGGMCSLLLPVDGEGSLLGVVAVVLVGEGSFEGGSVVEGVSGFVGVELLSCGREDKDCLS